MSFNNQIKKENSIKLNKFNNPNNNNSKKVINIENNISKIQIDTMEIDNIENNKPKLTEDNVIKAIEKNFDQNTKINDTFNQELYKRVNNEISKLARNNR